eukprot:1307713-Rhodomonas_salina.1
MRRQSARRSPTRTASTATTTGRKDWAPATSRVRTKATRRARSTVSTSLPPSFLHSLTRPLPRSPDAAFGFRTLFGLRSRMQNT